MTNAQLSQRRRHARRIVRQRARRAARIAAGLRYDGKPLQRRRHDDLVNEWGTPLHGPARKKAIDLKLRMENVALGLTQQGRVRQLRQWPQLRGLEPRAYKNAWRRLITAERRLAGFTGKGKPLKRFSGQTPARRLKDISWAFFRRNLGHCQSADFLTRLERDAA